ncbi:MAG: 16S rRNA (cytidine(1402)-2'-O)-methyltransferase [Oscillospiraceae bacterium]|nr:16S rRNA (cytidine(1402)-2'-O)-methyltransferase [Oscillospiraceae bacterium]
MKTGSLYITGTPIGNLGDISSRALETLNNVDFIAAEDTRVSLKLLTKFGIKKPMLSCRKHNIREVSEKIIERLQNGESCALITDAGMPCISDPGAELVELCRTRGVQTVVVPGASALVAALALSGFMCQRFSFEGFLSINPKQRKERLLEVKNYGGLLIFYEAPHKLIKTLNDLLNVLGDRRIVLCREMTKIHEEVLDGRISEILRRYENPETPPRGEFVLILEAPDSDKAEAVTIEQAAKKVAELTASGYKPADACKIIAKETGLTKSLIYKEYLKNI